MPVSYTHLDVYKRQVRNGLEAVCSDLVAVHDAARPYVSEDVITRALSAALECGAAAPAVPVKDTVKRAENGLCLLYTSRCV